MDGYVLFKYQRKGFNVQAICNANLYFLHLAIGNKGQTNNACAFRNDSSFQKVGFH